MKTIYFMRPKGKRGPVKIGCSLWPASRLRSIEIWSPVLLEIAASAPGGHFHEHALHHMFAEYRLHGEWFKANDALAAIIDQVADSGALPLLDVTLPAVRARHQKRGVMPRRDNLKRVPKFRLTKKIQAAEQRAFGFADRTYFRPSEIEAIVASYQGFGSDPPSEADLTTIGEYLETLASMPAADRSLAAWQDRFRAAPATTPETPKQVRAA